MERLLQGSQGIPRQSERVLGVPGNRFQATEIGTQGSDTRCRGGGCKKRDFQGPTVSWDTACGGVKSDLGEM